MQPESRNLNNHSLDSSEDYYFLCCHIVVILKEDLQIMYRDLTLPRGKAGTAF